MYRLFLIFIFAISLCADSIKFQEQKYINSLHSTITREGNIEFNKNYIKVFYKNQSSNFVFFEDYLLIKDGKKEDKFSYEEKIELAIFYKLIKLLYQNQDDGIDEYFKIQKDNCCVTLLPNEYLSNSISKIEYKKTGNKLDFMQIYFSNEDYIKIVQD